MDLNGLMRHKPHTATEPGLKVKQGRKTECYYETLGAPTSFLPRVARGRRKEGESRRPKTFLR
jgi:hypothetical protein